MSKTVCIHMTQPVCSAAEIDNMVNQLHFNKIIKKKKRSGHSVAHSMEGHRGFGIMDHGPGVETETISWLIQTVPRTVKTEHSNSLASPHLFSSHKSVVHPDFWLY